MKKRQTYNDYLNAFADKDSKKMWAAISDICLDYAGNKKHAHFPQDIAYLFHEIANDAMQGKMPDVFLRLRQRGRKDNLKDKQIAVLYARAAEARIVLDRKYAKTIKDAYKITDRTWSSWRRALFEDQATDPVHFFPHLGKAERARILKTLIERSAGHYHAKKKSRPPALNS